MKKMIFLISLCLASMAMHSQNLLSNGDFEGGMTDWFGNAFNIQEDGGNNFNFANVQTAGNSFDVNLSQQIEIIEGETYTLTFDAVSDRNRTILAGIGLNSAPFTLVAEVASLTTEIQTFEFTLTANSFGSTNSRVLFDMGSEEGLVIIDNVILTNATLTTDEVTDLNWSVYPNPVIDILNIDIRDQEQNLEFALIEGTTGKILSRDLIRNHSINRINMTKYSSGLYFFAIYDKVNRNVLALEKLLKK